MIDIAPRGVAKLVLAGASFRPERAAWRARFHTSLLAHRALSGTLARRLKTCGDDFDLALQIGGWMSRQPRPYALYVDQSRLMAERGWPEWMPLSSRGRGRILELERQMYTEAAHILVMGASARDSLIAEYGVDPARITIAGGGLNFDRMPVACGPAASPTITFVGRDFERKGGDCLLRAFALVREELPSAALQLVGVGRRIEQPGVVSIGKVHSRERLAELYRSTRAFASPSRYEPWGLAFVEAMAHGLPCVGTTVQSIPEILDHGQAGLLVPPDEEEPLAQALLRLMRDDDLARSIGEAARRRVEGSLTWDHVAERVAPALAAAAAAPVA